MTRTKSKAATVRAWKDRNVLKWTETHPHSIEGTKKCPACKKEIDRKLYSLARNSKDGLQPRCGPCCEKKYRDELNVSIFKNAKARYKTLGVEFTITPDDIHVPEFCPALGIRLEVHRGRGANGSSPSLDRIDSSKGYTKDNIQVISWRANRLKSDATLEELQAVVSYVISCKDHA